MADNRKIGGAGTVTVDELVKAIWAGQPKPATASGIAISDQPLGTAVIPQELEERQGIDYQNASTLLFGMVLSDRLQWTRRSDDELRWFIDNQPDRRFYRGGIEWVPKE